jgi:hypothetical protein
MVKIANVIIIFEMRVLDKQTKKNSYDDAGQGLVCDYDDAGKRMQMRRASSGNVVQIVIEILACVFNELNGQLGGEPQLNRKHVTAVENDKCTPQRNGRRSRQSDPPKESQKRVEVGRKEAVGIHSSNG